MATEQEELRLTVTLADNASAGLEKLQAQIKELGGGGAGGNKHIEKLDEQTKLLTESVLKMTGGFGEAFKSLGMLRLGFIGGIAGVAAFGYEMAKQIKDLGEYTDKIRNLGQIGKDIGIDPSSIKNISEQLQVFGVSSDQAVASIAKFAGKMAELQRDPRVRMDILTKTDPAQQANMNQWLDKLNAAKDIEDKLNIARQMRANVERNAIVLQHQSAEQAADTANKIMGGLLSYDAELSRAGNLVKLSDEERSAWAAKQAAADHYSETLGKIRGNLESIAEIQKESLTSKDSWATFAAEQFERLTKSILDFEKTGGLQGIYKRALKDEQDADPHSFGERWPAPDEQFKQLPNPRLQKQSYSGAADQSLLHQAAFVGEDHKKGVEQNTDQLKRLNDLLSQAIGQNGAAEGGGGLQNAAFTTRDGLGAGGIGGRGTTPRFGSAEYPNLGTDFGAAKPYGSHVGAGAGAGAGETPAGPPGGGGDPSLTGNAFLASQRARLKKEMDDNPELKRRFAAIIERENPTAGAQVAESAMNRAAMTGRSMASILGGGSKSFYGPVRHGLIEPTMRSMSDKTLAARYRQIDAGLAGGNLVKGATDQGSAGDPNFVTGGHFIPDVNRERFNDWGGYRGVDYSRHWRAAQQAQVARSSADIAAARQSLDAEQAATTKVEGSGKIRVDVNAPKGTNVGAEGGGLFKTIEMYRQTQMQDAQRGPPAWGPTQ